MPTTEERLSRFYVKYNPEKLRLVATVLKQFADRDDELFAMLVDKYGPEPSHDEVLAMPAEMPVPDDIGVYRRRLTRLLERYDPSQLEHVDALLEGHRGKEEVMLLFLVSRYGPEPE